MRALARLMARRTSGVLRQSHRAWRFGRSTEPVVLARAMRGSGLFRPGGSGSQYAIPAARQHLGTFLGRQQRGGSGAWPESPG